MTDQSLITAAATLARTAPQAWDMFLRALAERNIAASEALVSSDAATLTINQGRAQAYRSMYTTCRDALNKQREIEGRANNG